MNFFLYGFSLQGVSILYMMKTVQNILVKGSTKKLLFL